MCDMTYLHQQTFPREGDGLDYEFNWSLNGDGITPHGDAFRNLDTERLQEVSGQTSFTAGICDYNTIL